MSRRLEFTLRLLWLPAVGVFLYWLLSHAATSVNNFLYAFAEFGIPSRTREQLVFAAFASILTIHLILELVSHISELSMRPRLMKHLRYGPLAVFVISTMSVIVFDAAMIEISKYKIRSYVYSERSIVSEPDFGILHNNDRGWCGNGVSATYEWNYYATASTGLTDPDPAVRARALLASAIVRDFLNGSPQFRSHTADACKDESELVRSTAESQLAKWGSSCSKMLLEPVDKKLTR